jgi:hypothetical protein
MDSHQLAPAIRQNARGEAMRLIVIFLLGMLTAVSASAETQAEHDRRTNYDGYGSERNRYENAILMKTHDSILQGGKLEYWNGVDDYYYWKYRSGQRLPARQGDFRKHNRRSGR